MDKANILAFAAESHSRCVHALLENKSGDGREFGTSGQRYAYVAGVQSVVIEKLIDYIKNH